MFQPMAIYNQLFLLAWCTYYEFQKSSKCKVMLLGHRGGQSTVRGSLGPLAGGLPGPDADERGG